MRTKLVILLLINVSIISCEKSAPDNDPVNELSSIRGYKNYSIGTFRCGVFVPPSYTETKKYPFVIYLHGHTDTVRWNLSWYNEPFLSSDPCIILTPKCPKEEIYGWGDSFHTGTSPMMVKTYEMMDLAKQAFNLDTDRFYIHGTSMGGYGTYGAIQKNPGLFAAAYVKCGAGNPEMADLLVDFPLWILHGSEDQVVPVHWAREMYNSIRALGGTQIKYTEYPGVGHNIWEYPLNEDFWLVSQVKNSEHGVPDGVVGFNGVLNTEHNVSLTWDPPTETKSDNKVWYYNVYLNNEIIREIFSPLKAFTDSAIVTGMIYTYRISVVSFFFKESAASASISLRISEK